MCFQDNKADVILKYNAEEARSLKAYGELPEHGEDSQTPVGDDICHPFCFFITDMLSSSSQPKSMNGTPVRKTRSSSTTTVLMARTPMM